MITRAGSMPDASIALLNAHPHVQWPPREKSQRSGCASTHSTDKPGCRRTWAAMVEIAVQWSPPSTVKNESGETCASLCIGSIQPPSMSSPGSRSPMSST